MKKLLLPILLLAYASPSLARESKITEPFKGQDIFTRIDKERQPTFKHSETGLKLIIAVNHEVNLLRYIEEPAGQDYWQTPAETFKIGGGDCEDLAILKWKMFVDAGIPEKDIWFLQGWTKDTNEAHVELFVKLEGKTYYLDNLNFNIYEPQISLKQAVKFNRFETILIQE